MLYYFLGNWVIYVCEKSFNLKIIEIGGNYEMLVDVMIKVD